MEELNSINPFSSSEFKKMILEKEGLLDNNSSTTEYEILSPIDEGKYNSDDSTNKFSSESGKMIMPDLGIPKSATNIIHDASLLSSRDKISRAKEISNALNQIFSEYNVKYGLNVKVNFDSISDTMISLSDPNQRRTLELYLSESFSSFRAIVYLRIMSSLAMIIDNILDPMKLMSNDLAYEDKFIIVEKCLQFVDQIESLKKSINIIGAEGEMRKLSEDMNKQGSDEDMDNNPAVKEFMKSLMASSIKDDNK